MNSIEQQLQSKIARNQNILAARIQVYKDANLPLKWFYSDYKEDIETQTLLKKALRAIVWQQRDKKFVAAAHEAEIEFSTFLMKEQ